MGSGLSRHVPASAHDWSQVLIFQGKSCPLFFRSFTISVQECYMTQGMVEQQGMLTRLVEEAYDGRRVVLQPISPHLLEDRGIYRVDWEGGTSSVLRAFLADVTVELIGHAAVLDYLQQRG